MRNTKTKGKTMTKALSKCHKRFIAHNEVQWAYADILEGKIAPEGAIFKHYR